MITKNFLKLNLRVPFKLEISIPFNSLKSTVDSTCDEIYEVNLGVSCTQFYTIDFTLLEDLIVN